VKILWIWDQAIKLIDQLNHFTEELSDQEKKELDEIWKQELNDSLGFDKRDIAPVNAVVSRPPEIVQGNTLNNMLSQPKVQAVVEAITNGPQSPTDSELNQYWGYQNQELITAEVIIGGQTVVDRSAVSVIWDSTMGYMHGLAGAQGAYENRSDDYKFSWNLANNAMTTLADAFGKVAETAPPVLPGGNLTPSMKLAAGGAVARTASKSASLAPIYFSSEGGSESKKQETKQNTENSKGPRKAGTGEQVLDQVKSYEQARNKALDLVGDLGPDSKPYVGRLGTGEGKIVGRQSADGKVRWRLDYDPEKGPHINVEDFRNGKGDNATKVAIPFDGDMKTVEELLKYLNK
jgi:hypothetical protein